MNLDDIPSDKVSDQISSPSKVSSSKRIEKTPNVKVKGLKSPLGMSQKSITEIIGLQRPYSSHKKTGFITKVHGTEENRDLLAGRKKILRKKNVEKLNELNRTN